MDDLLTAKEVEALVRMSRQGIFKLRQAGHFPQPSKVGIRALRWSKAEVEAWFENRKCK